MVAEKKKKPSVTQTRWDHTMAVRAYIAAKAGFLDKDIYAQLQIPESTWMRWKLEHSDLQFALEKGREKNPEDQVEPFGDYVYSKLTPELQKLWDEMAYWFEHANGQERINTLLHDKPTLIRQQLWLHAMVVTNFNASDAGFMTGIPRSLLLRWEKDDPNFPKLMDEVLFHKKNWYEKALSNLTMMHNPQAVIFANRTLNANRGFGEKVEVEHKGTIRHEHRFIKLSDLELPLDVRCAVLDALDAKQEKDKIAASKGPQQTLEASMS